MSGPDVTGDRRSCRDDHFPVPVVQNTQSSVNTFHDDLPLVSYNPSEPASYPQSSLNPPNPHPRIPQRRPGVFVPVARSLIFSAYHTATLPSPRLVPVLCDFHSACKRKSNPIGARQHAQVARAMVSFLDSARRMYRSKTQKRARRQRPTVSPLVCY